jgi:hypothetical protein
VAAAAVVVVVVVVVVSLAGVQPCWPHPAGDYAASWLVAGLHAVTAWCQLLLTTSASAPVAAAHNAAAAAAAAGDAVNVRAALLLFCRSLLAQRCCVHTLYACLQQTLRLQKYQMSEGCW